MKRFGWILLVFVAFFFAFQGFLVPDASADGKMFKSAGAALKEKAETDLRFLAGNVQGHFYKMPDNGYLGKRAMQNLEVYVWGFEKSKIDYDAALKLYGLRTETILDPIYRKIVDVYFLRGEMNGRTPRDFFYGDSKNETIRRIFAERFGVDVKVWRGMNKAKGGDSVFVFLAVLSCVVCLIGWVTDIFRFRWTVYFVLFWFSFFILPI